MSEARESTELDSANELTNEPGQAKPAISPAPMEPEDYYFENGLMVFTGRYHLKRGYCCNSGCRHCPFR